MIYNIILIIILIIIILFFFNKKIYVIESFCKVPYLNSQGEINNKNVSLDYKAQSDIYTSSCNEYWKKTPLEYNNTLVDNEPINIYTDQLDLIKTNKFGNYIYGLIDFTKILDIIDDKYNKDMFKISKELLIDPITKEKLNYYYELEYVYYELNKKTWINRWEKYNPNIDYNNNFNYNDIKSPIENINILNNEFINRLNNNQKVLISKREMIDFGVISYFILKYKILYILYIDSDINKPVYVMQISILKNNEYYVNSFSYIGFIDNNNKIYLTDIKYIGKNTVDNFLLANYSNMNEINNEIINNNFTNKVTIEKDPDAILSLTNEHLESYKINKQYACFNQNYDPTKNDYILNYNNKTQCESIYDSYGNIKSFGVYDKPCEENEECPFYKINKNYPNDYGKCLNGYCEMPLNIDRIGYRFYKSDKNNYPLCYNCNPDKFEFITDMGNCCNDQSDTKKYPFLSSPDIIFNQDKINRLNYFNFADYYKKNNDII